MLSLSSEILDASWYPAGRVFTEFEARIDFLLYTETPSNDWRAFIKRWSWPSDKVNAFIQVLVKEDFRNQFTIEPPPKQQREVAQKVIDLFNATFKKKAILNEHRLRLISARIKEGKKMQPKVGISQFQAVFEWKKKEWLGSEFEKYLRIETLCSASHFVPYLEEARVDYQKRKNHIEKKGSTTIEGSHFS